MPNLFLKRKIKTGVTMNRRNILIFLLCVMLGFGIIIQGKAAHGEMLYVSAKAITDYKTTIDSEKMEIEKTKNLIEESKRELVLYQDSNTDNTDLLVSNIEKEKNLYEMFSGAMDLKGPGVIITIDDGVRPLFEGEDINNILVHDADILIIINDLKKNGAEAISVNGEMICSSHGRQLKNKTVYNERSFIMSKRSKCSGRVSCWRNITTKFMF